MTWQKEEKSRRRRRRRTKFSSFWIFNCFRSTVDDNETISEPLKAGPASVIEKAHLPLPLPAQPADGRTDKKGRRRLSATIKAVFFETSLGKKSRKSKSSRDSDASSSRGKLSSFLSDCTDSTNGSRRRIGDSSVTASSLSLNSSTRYNSSRSSSWSCYNSSSKNPSRSSSLGSSQRKDISKKQRTRSHHGVCVLIITLVVVVLWGKVCAIICTSTSLYIMVHRSIEHPRANTGMCGVMDSAEYKKRVVLGGFLDRRRSRSLLYR